MSDMQHLRCLVVATSVLGCGDVATHDTHVDAGPAAAPLNRCAPDPCLLSDEFSGTTLDPGLWKTTTSGGATVTQASGILSLRLPAAANASVDVVSLVGFPVGATFEAAVTFTANQFYDHKGVGFASAAVNSGCDTGEMEAAMFRGQDNDGYVEVKTGGKATCTMTLHNYPAGTNTYRITRLADQVQFAQNNVDYGPIKTNVPGGLLPVRFSAYTFTTPPMKPVQIDIDYVFVRHP